MTKPRPTGHVTPGSVWADNVQPARTIRVVRIDVNRAVCEVLTNRAHTQAGLDAGERWYRDMRGSTTEILLHAFRSGPAKTGYSPAPTEEPQS